MWEQILHRPNASQAPPWLPRCHRDQEGSWLYSHRTQPTWWALLSPSLYFFFFSWLHELPSWCVPSHYWWASTLVRRQDTGEKERGPVCSTRRLFDCQHMSLVISPPVSCSLHQVEEASVEASAVRYALPTITRLWWRKKRNLTLLILRPSTLKLRLCGHRYRCSGG